VSLLYGDVSNVVAAVLLAVVVVGVNSVFGLFNRKFVSPNVL